ncbi:glycosyltransferase family 4 protein [Pseudoclavibacter sp. CFCC 13796]|uniref:glycosyltransferase n=1 Tax=Pseudoclavibacter sp. CFCC 13796 TaxID=2615179 RepID=UPI001300F31F|nr:glycosyltransferase [Pseudoclavibacter sp. CFCC 13796]KAB1661085.1 glycosyltransferase family 4 protein [Pseudoclavibacter sp. CFCC 13796]
MRVVIVNTAYSPDLLGGAERSVGELAQGLAERGHSVSVICLGSWRAEDDEGAVKIKRLFRRRLDYVTRGSASAVWKALWHATELVRLGSFMRLRALFRELDPDIVHFNNLSGFGIAAWASARKIPSIQTCRDYSLICTSALGQRNGEDRSGREVANRILKGVYRLKTFAPSLVVGVSDYVSKRMEAAGVSGRLGRNVTVYNRPDSIPLSDHRQDGSVRFGFIGRVSKDKGIEVVLEAFKMANIEGAHFIVAGGGETNYIEHLQRRFQSEVEAGAITFAGPVLPQEYYPSVDIALVPSQWQEPFGRVAAEALMSGSGLIYSEAGGLPEVASLYGGDSSPVHDYTSPDAWAQAMSRAARQEWYSSTSRHPPVDTPVDRYSKLYDRVLAAERGSDAS